MPPESIRSSQVRFAQDFELDLRLHRLRRSGRLLKVERIPLELLGLLIEHHGEVVSRKEIATHIWGEDVYLDTDNSINGAIRKIRQVLRDDSDQPRFIETISGKGYRFIAPVLETVPPEIPDKEAVLLSVPFPIPTEPLSEGPTRRTSFYVALCAILVLSIATIAYLRWPRRPAAPPNGKIMLAVLPFANLTGDPAQEYFSDGLTEEMIARLGDLNPQHLGVIARTSVMNYKDTRIDLNQLRRDLGIEYVLEGSVRRDATEVRVTAQLIQLSDGTHVWARQYDRQLTNLIGLQEEIAHEIAGEIQITLVDTGKPARDRSANLTSAQYESYDLYLQGRYFWNKRTAEGFRQAIDLFNQALQEDPLNARAHAGLADCYVLLSNYGLSEPAEAFPKARVSALRALELNDKLAEAHTSLGAIYLFFDWNWQAAEKEYQRAIVLDPNYSTAHHWYAELLALEGRFDEAFASSERAHRLDPLSLIIATDHAVWLHYARRYEDAIRQFNTVRSLDPHFPRVHMITYAFVEEGRFPEALSNVQSWRRYDQSPWTWALETYLESRRGHPQEAREALAELRRQSRNANFDPAPMLVVAYIGMGEIDRAIKLLQRSVAHRDSYVTTLKVDPLYDPLRSDPRFQALVKTIHLVE